MDIKKVFIKTISKMAVKGGIFVKFAKIPPLT